MPQLCILIPYSGNNQDLETTLVSVLENRPNDCEIIVAHAGDYQDPYNLTDEVRFLEIDTLTIELGKLVSEVIDTTDAPFLHLLGCGAQVPRGWTEGVLERFDDPYIGSLCPILTDENDEILCVGVENSMLYHTRHLGKGKSLGTLDPALLEPVGPSHHAGFYRVAALQEVTCLPDFSDSMLGMEIALSLEAIGYESGIVNSAVIQTSCTAISTESPGDSQRAIWRFAGSLGLVQGMALTGLGILVDTLTAPFSATRRNSLVSRLGKLIDMGSARAFREFVEQARGPEPATQTLQLPSYNISLTGSELESERRAA